MSIRWKARTATMVALVLGVFVGGMLGALLAQHTSADAQTATIIEPERTVYVDFVDVLKKDAVLLSVQIEIYQEAVQRKRELAMRAERQIKAKQEDLKTKSAKTEEYAKLMEELIQLNAKYTRERYDIDLDMQSDINEEAKKRFNQLKKYAIEIAEKHKATQILVVSSEPTDKMDFSDLQKALMLSPVLHYSRGYDITAELRARADLDKVNFECDDVYGVKPDGGKLEKMAKDDPKTAPKQRVNPDNIDYEVAAGAKLLLRGEFSDLNKSSSKREKIAADALVGGADKANPYWNLRGEGDVKTLPNGDAEYLAPGEWPTGMPKDKPLVVEIEVAPFKARDKSKVLRVRVLPPATKEK